MKKLVASLVLFSFAYFSMAQTLDHTHSTTTIDKKQQIHHQLSNGGKPWSFKFQEYDHLISYETMPDVDVNALLEEDALLESQNIKTLRFGYDHFVSLKPTNSGTWKTLANGDKIWRLGINSPGALSINLSFKSIELPEGCQFFVYTSDKSQYHGAFTQAHVTPDDKMLGTELLYSDKVIVELFVPGSVTEELSLEIWRITHGYRDLSQTIMKAFGASGACENNARCPAYAAWDDQIRSGICLVNGGEFCSAALINNTCNDGTPYVLTANHCGSSGFGSWVFRFNWEAPGCTNPGSSPSSNSISGSVQRAAFAGSDMSLLQMNSTPPSSYNVYYAGWDRNNTNPTNPFGVHHPSGDIKKFSQATGTGATATYGSATCWQTPIWTDGVTEPGSSGSPLFNSSGLIIGQLYGGPSNCSCEGSASCGYDYYGKLFTSWTGGGTSASRLSNWLDPCSTGATVLLGYDPNAPTVAVDAGINAINVPENGLSSCENTFTPEVVLKNFGSTALTSCTINYHLDAATPSTFSWTGSLASGATTTITLPGFTATAGAHTYTVFTSNPNGTTDLNTANDSKTNSFTVLTVPVGVALPFTQGFESTTFIPTGWTLENPESNTTWTRVTAASGFGTSTACAKFDNFSPSTSIAGQSDYMVTPAIDLSSATGTLQMDFNVAYARYSATYTDTLKVGISVDCGSTWTNLYVKGGTTLATVADMTSAFTPTSTQWRAESIDLTSYAGLSSVQFRFENLSGWGNNLYVDDINIYSNVVVPPVADFTGLPTSICAGETVTFTNASTGATTYSWTLSGGTPSTSSSANPTVTYNTAGTYNVTLVATNSAGSDTEVKTSYIVVNPLPPTPTIGIAGSVLTATPSTGYTYQWFLNGTPITGATSSSYTVTSAGTYTVEITDTNGCSSLSSGFVFTSVGEVGSSQLDFSVMPNPNDGNFDVVVNVKEEGRLLVHNALGELILEEPVRGNGQNIRFSQNLSKGVYVITLTEGNQSLRKKIIVK